MAWFAYISKECREAAQEHGVLPNVKKLQETVEELQQDCLPRFHQFPPPYLVKKKFADKAGRLIAERREIREGKEEHTVIVFLDFMTKGNTDYEKSFGFGKDPVAYGKSHYDGLVEEDKLKEYIVKTRPKIQEPPPPSEFEYGYLHAALGANYEDRSDGYIYESTEWNTAINQEYFIAHHSRIFEKLSEFSAAGESKPQIVPISDKIAALGYYFPKDKIHFFAGLGAPEAIAELQEKYDAVFSRNTSAGTLAKYACRAYPAMVLAADLEFWRTIEKKGSGNMALSPEESRLLQRIVCSPNTAYPLFINGRAGSGKSTILQYLFSYYMEYYLKHCGSAEAESRPLPPLYLTWSTTLLETARRNVEAFLKCSTRNLGEEGQQITDRDIEETFPGAFRSFQSFMLEQIPLEQRALFKPDRHISYARFVEMWRNKFGNEQRIFKLGPEICWHIIRTFIKGTNIEDFLEPEDYRDGLRKEQTVSQQNYELVFERVWEKWYRELTVGANDEPGQWWDDQDLIRYVIRHNYCSREYPVVFCDEAQDFTRIELNAILNLSLFSHRKIYSHEVSQLPFAFAGDPFQTLNPTGFRWGAIKNSFVEQFINSHHRGDGGKMPELNYCELENNYRSDAAIVKFSNDVQVLRSKALQQHIQPQKPWWEGRTGIVAYFDKTDSSFWDWVKDHPEVVFVVPCDRDGEEAYWQSSGMSGFVPFGDVTVMSTIAIKGLEYGTIVVCGFGEESPTVLEQYLVEALPEETDGAGDEKLTVEYFINKLYVAVSRAQNRLLILDSDQGKERLWQVFMREDLTSLLPEGTDRELYLRLQPGDARTLAGEEQVGSSPTEDAKRFFADGESQRSPYLIRRAKRLYADAGIVQRAAICEAWALFFEKKYHEAAEADRDANYTLKHRCWWLEGTTESLQKIVDSQNQNSDFLASEEVRLLNRCLHPGSSLPEVLSVLDDVYSVYTQTGRLFEPENATPAWKQLVGRLFSSGALSCNLADDVKVRVWDLLEKFRQFGLAADSIAGRLAFQCGHFLEAAEWLKDEKDPELVDIRKKAEQQAKPLDAQVQSVYAIRNWEAVVNLYRENPDASFSYHSMVQIAIASAVRGDTFVAGNLFRTRYSSGLLTALLEEKEISKEVIKKLEADNLRAMVAHCDYPAIIKFLKGRFFPQEQVIFFIRLFARCDAESFQNNAPRELLSETTSFIVNFLSKCKKSTWKQYFFEIGCALEKANNIKVAKDFYLDESKSLPAADQQEALRRALVCYERHAEVVSEERAKRFQLRKAEELREKLNLVGVKRGDSRLPEYKFGIDPWFDLENFRSSALAEESQSRLSEKKPTTVAFLPPVPAEKPTPPKLAVGTKPVSAPPEQKASQPKREEVPLGSLNVAESGGSEDLAELTIRGEELFAQLTTAEAVFFPLREEKIDELLTKSQLLAELCRKLLNGDGSEEWQSATAEADSFAALREVLSKRAAEQQARERRKEFLCFLNDLRTAVGHLELKPITNKRQKKRAEDDLSQIKQAVTQAKIEFSEERTLPSNWSPSQDASEWLRENLLVEPERLDEDRIQAVLPFDEDTCEKLLEWHDKLILP